MRSIWACLAVAALLMGVAGCKKASEPEEVTVYDKDVDGENPVSAGALDPSLLTGKWGAGGTSGSAGGTITPSGTTPSTPTGGGTVPQVPLTGDPVADVKATLASIGQVDLKADPSLLAEYLVPEQAGQIKSLIPVAMQIPIAQKAAVDVVRAKLGDAFAAKLQGGNMPSADQMAEDLKKELTDLDKLQFAAAGEEVTVTDPESPGKPIIFRKVNGQYRAYIPMLDGPQGKQILDAVPAALGALNEFYSSLAQGVSTGEITAENFDQKMQAGAMAMMGRLIPLMGLIAGPGTPPDGGGTTPPEPGLPPMGTVPE